MADKAKTKDDRKPVSKRSVKPPFRPLLRSEIVISEERWDLPQMCKALRKIAAQAYDLHTALRRENYDTPDNRMLQTAKQMNSALKKVEGMYTKQMTIVHRRMEQLAEKIHGE